MTRLSLAIMAAGSFAVEFLTASAVPAAEPNMVPVSAATTLFLLGAIAGSLLTILALGILADRMARRAMREEGDAT